MSHNKTFNLQFFLNNAMNIMDFVESITSKSVI